MGHMDKTRKFPDIGQDICGVILTPDTGQDMKEGGGGRGRNIPDLFKHLPFPSIAQAHMSYSLLAEILLHHTTQIQPCPHPHTAAHPMGTSLTLFSSSLRRVPI